MHGFRTGRGRGTASIELKLRIQLATIHQIPLHVIFLDLKKAYDSIHRGGTLDILQGYSVGPQLLHLLRNLWGAQKTVVRQNGYNSNPFSVECGVTQGDIPSPKIFNIVVDAVIRCWTVEALEDKDVQTSSIFYVDDGVLTSNDAISLQKSSDHLLSLFRRVNLEANTKKSKSMISLPGKVKGQISSSAYDRRMSGEGVSYKDREQRKVQCKKCGSTLASASLGNNLLQQHGIQFTATRVGASGELYANPYMIVSLEDYLLTVYSKAYTREALFGAAFF
jgi:hypothetical protein